jgi:hypothetical protein
MNLSQIATPFIAAVGSATLLPGASASHPLAHEFDGAHSVMRTNLSLPREQRLPGTYLGRPGNIDGPETYSEFVAEELADLRRVCVVGNGDDRKNCLLGLPPGERTEVSVSRLVDAGCGASLPDDIRRALSSSGREPWQLAREYRKQFNRLLRGEYSVEALEGRIKDAISALPDTVQQSIRHANTPLIVPRYTFHRRAESADEARRNGVKFENPDDYGTVKVGPDFSRDAPLGLYIPLIGSHTESVSVLLVSLANRDGLMTYVPFAGPRRDSAQWPMYEEALLRDRANFLPASDGDFEERIRRHAFGYAQQLVGAPITKMRPDLLETEFSALPRGGNVERTLAQFLHNGFRRFMEFAAYGPPERRARDSQSHQRIKQELCDAGTFGGMTSHDRAQRLAEIEAWMDQVEKEERSLQQMGRPRFG